MAFQPVSIHDSFHCGQSQSHLLCLFLPKGFCIVYRWWQFILVDLLVCTDECGDFRPLQFVPKDEPGFWRSSLLILISWLISFFLNLCIMSHKEVLCVRRFLKIRDLWAFEETFKFDLSPIIVAHRKFKKLI